MMINVAFSFLCALAYFLSLHLLFKSKLKMGKQQVIICDNPIAELEKFIQDQSEESIYILADQNSYKLCFPLLAVSPKLAKARIHIIMAGDSHKTINTLSSVWEFLSNNGATRKSMLINLGGGMVTDLGGFAASTFKRGMKYINVATTLLGAVDAAVGGKTGVNFNGLKNEIGAINPAEAVLIDTMFFKTLDHANLISGYAEILKHALIYNKEEWAKVAAYDMEKFDLDELKPLLADSIAVKERIVEEDPFEQGLRKALNFGHTVGHAFESISYEKGTPVLHGYAVAWGMISELYMSHKMLGFPKETLMQAVNIIKENYGSLAITCDDYDRLYELMTHDKKNDTKEINFTLLGDVGDIRTNQHATQKLIFESIDFYRDCVGL